MIVACAGHWLASLLFLVPVAGVVAALRLATWRADRQHVAGELARPMP